MRRLIVFNQVTLDGFIADARGDMSWAHRSDAEWNAFVEENARGGGELVFGRVTYDLMASFWPTLAALQSFPVVAERMNELPKVVFTRSMARASWHNTRVINGDTAAEMRKLKQEPGAGLAIFGSGSLVAPLTRAGLIDEYQLVVNPVVLGGGKSMFAGLDRKLDLRLTRSRVFANGNVLLCYEPKPV